MRAGSSEAAGVWSTPRVPQLTREWAFSACSVCNASRLQPGRMLAVPASEEVLINAEHLWADRSAPLSLSTPKEILKPALHGGASDSLPLAQAAAADPVPMLQVNTAAERFGGPFVRQNAREALPETAPALPTLPFSAFQFQNRMPGSPAFVPRLPKAPILYPQADAAAVRAGYRPDLEPAGLIVQLQRTQFPDGDHSIIDQKPKR